MNKKQIHIKMDSMLHTLLKVEAAKKDMSMQDFVIDILSFYFSNKKTKEDERSCNEVD